MSTDTASATERPAPETLTLYTTSWCPFCLKLKAALREDEIDYAEIDIEDTPDAAAFVAAHNDGNHVVPTVHFPSGEIVTNPPAKGVRRRLGAPQD